MKAVLAALALAAVTLAAPATGAGEPSGTALRLARAPYLGVRCPEPNRIGCDRVGLAVWLARPAVRLRATIAGKPVRMTIPRGRDGPRGTYFEGSLRPAGLTGPGPLRVRPDGPGGYWAGGHPVSARVRLVASYRDGTSARATVRVSLRPGWG